VLLAAFFLPSAALADDAAGISVLHAATEDWTSILPPGSQILDDPTTIEPFLAALDGTPPDWRVIYGHNGEGHDDRLFELNRARDARRHVPVHRDSISFLWPGELSAYDAEAGGFRVAIGPRVITTKWGDVRFKPDGLPSSLIASVTPDEREALLRRQAARGPVTVEVAMTGVLVIEESLIYDFSHDEAGRGVIMPVVAVDRIDYRVAQTAGSGDHEPPSH
jgi:hypothetical protein